MATLKLSDDFYEPTCSLVAVHCPMEAYRLAYFLNLHLQIGLRRTAGKEPNEGDMLSEYYEWENRMEETVWSLIVNATRTTVSSAGNALFPSDVLTMTKYLIPEMKKVDYFLKIDNAEGYDIDRQIVQRINKIPRIATAYEVDVNQLKSKHNLIFL
ncbi:IPExxxVDY family protein [Sinomicrobium pectinilyticum]|uniref:IPExxxVDY family protein n=1 Tax=Sinomicrobium pectinilyticum TaxID=1084421 RepID=A0A3N0EYS3_SINP1|nr:IPExxxVDY family protein [Sinomicrobium pectinilyticum]RNL92984.1 IPExxxVDY family protein [Sinomicrobium pectinilyticum]